MLKHRPLPKNSSKSTAVAPFKAPTAPTYTADFIITPDAVTCKSATRKAEEINPHVLTLAQRILCHRRPSNSPLLASWVKDVFMPLLKEHMSEEAEEPVVDDYGNVIVEVTHDCEYSSTMFTAHLDTVHHDANPKALTNKATQQVAYDATKRVLFKQDNECLGADDGTGVYIMLQMIKAGVPGCYAFFLDEEIGRQGSIALGRSDMFQQKLKGVIKRCISFDRAGSTDVITRQLCGVCASDTFAKALSEQLKKHSGFDYKPSPNGSYTDSATFSFNIPECTNVSVGYKSQHGPNETQNVQVMLKLIDAVTKVKWDELPVERDPHNDDKDLFDYDVGFDYGYTRKPTTVTFEQRLECIETLLAPDPDAEELAELLQAYPYACARALLEEYGLGADDVYDLVQGMLR
jgi:hypothetical protein